MKDPPGQHTGKNKLEDKGPGKKGLRTALSA